MFTQLSGILTIIIEMRISISFLCLASGVGFVQAVIVVLCGVIGQDHLA